MPSPAAEDDNLWARILDEVQSKSSSKFPPASVLILGDNESGKTTLIAHLKRSEEIRKGAGLEYHFLNVNSDYKDGAFGYQLGSGLPDVGPDEQARLGAWILDGDPSYSPLIRHAVQPNLENMVVLLCASMTQPWALLESLQRWARILRDELDRPGFIDSPIMSEACEKQVRFWQEYVEPLDSSSHSDNGARVPSMETDHILLPLSESVLSQNLGVSIIVVITKTDNMTSLEKEYDLKDEHFDYIQIQIRNFCLQYGAALCYTSVKENRNCDMLYKYIIHRVYGFPFTSPALVVDKDSIFVPAGWDNDKKIGILHENLIGLKPEDSFSDVVAKPVLKRPVVRDQEITAEDEQAFLMRQQTLLATQQSSGGGGPATPSVQAGGRSPSLTQKNIGKSPTPMAAAAAQNRQGQQIPAGNEGVLASFFNQLLLKKGPGTPGETTPPQAPLINGKTAENGPVNHMDETEMAQQALQRMLDKGKQEEINANEPIDVPVPNDQTESAEPRKPSIPAGTNDRIETAAPRKPSGTADGDVPDAPSEDQAENELLASSEDATMLEKQLPAEPAVVQQQEQLVNGE